MELFFKIVFFIMEKPDNKEVGKRLEGLMVDLRLKSRRAFALSVGADPSFFDKIMKGTATLTDGYAKLIEEKYGVNKEWLFTGKGDKHPGGKEKAREIDYQAKYYELLEKEKKALEDDKAFFKEIIKTNLAVILLDVQSISSRQKGSGETVLRSLERIEKVEDGSLVKEADNRTDQIEKEAHTRGNAAEMGSLDMENS